jgi:hypothetical protein
MSVFQCKFCRISFTSRGKLNQHNRRHIVTPKCQLCSAFFETEDELTSHRELHFRSVATQTSPQVSRPPKSRSREEPFREAKRPRCRSRESAREKPAARATERREVGRAWKPAAGEPAPTPRLELSSVIKATPTDPLGLMDEFELLAPTRLITFADWGLSPFPHIPQWPFSGPPLFTQSCSDLSRPVLTKVSSCLA